MSARTTPLVITVLYTDRLGVTGPVLVNELKQLIVPIVNVRRHPLHGELTRQVIITPFRVTSIGDGGVDLAVFISGEPDRQVTVAYGARVGAIKTGLNLLYEDVKTDVQIEERGLTILNLKPRMAASSHDDQLRVIYESGVQAVRAERTRLQQQKEAHEASLAELDKELGVNHDHKPGTPVTYHT
jgi:hypothetical protein